MTKRFMTASVILLAATTGAALGAQTPLPPAREYVTVRDGHLSQDGKRVRFWGAIGGFPGKNQADNVAVVKRLGDLGFNLVRYWQGFNQPTPYIKGDGSKADLADHFLAEMKQQGMRAWCAGTNNVGKALPADVTIVDDLGTAQAWQQAVGEKGMNLRGNVARIWDRRFEALGIARMKAVGDHVNQHTGLRWADDSVFAIWELSNEEWWFGHMVAGDWQKQPAFFQRELLAQWNQFVRTKYGSEDKLRAAWLGLLPDESFAKQSILLLPLRSGTQPDAQRKALGVNIQEGVAQKFGPDDFNAARGRDVIEFLVGIWVKHKQREHDALKSWGQSTKLSPLVWDTGIGYEIQAQFLHQHADAVAHDTYITGFHHDPTYKRYPWYSGLEELPRMCWDKPWIEHNRLEGKPYLVYETQIEQPAKYRAEYPMRIAALGAIQDWDAVCWHYFGHVPDSSQPKPYEKALDYTRAGGHPQGYHYEFDEVQLSAMRAAAAIFKQGLLQPAPNPTQFIYGRKSLYDPRSMDYGRSYGPIGERMLPTTYRYGVRLRIDPTRDDDEVIGPSYKPRVYEPNPLKPTDQITYDWHRGHLRFDAPAVASYTGFFAQHGGPVTFGNGVTLRDVEINNPPGIAFPVTPDEKYVAFTLASEDGLPLAQTRRALVSLVSTSFNSGFQLDLSKLKNEFGWFLNGGATVSTGGLPVLVARVGATIDAPMLNNMRYRLLDWHGNEVGKGVVQNGVLKIPSNVPVFLVRLERTQGGNETASADANQ